MEQEQKVEEGRMGTKKQNSLVISDLSVQVETLTEKEMSQVAGGDKLISRNGLGVGGGRGPGNNDV
jgi:bacteriocin-like protein